MSLSVASIHIVPTRVKVYWKFKGCHHGLWQRIHIQPMEPSDQSTDDQRTVLESGNSSTQTCVQVRSQTNSDWKNQFECAAAQQPPVCRWFEPGHDSLRRRFWNVGNQDSGTARLATPGQPLVIPRVHGGDAFRNNRQTVAKSPAKARDRGLEIRFLSHRQKIVVRNMLKQFGTTDLSPSIEKNKS